MPELKIGDRVRVTSHFYSEHYIGLIGKVSWLSLDGGKTIQIETETRPKWYRSAKPPWVITCITSQVERVE